MELQPVRQLDYLQRTLSIFLANSSDMSEQFELLIDELIRENKQSNKSPKASPESIVSDSKSEVPAASTSPQPLPKKRSAPVNANTKPPPSKRLKSAATKDEDESTKKKKSQSEEKISTTEKDDDIYDDENSSDESKSKSSESQDNPSTSAASRDIDEFAIELGLVCNKCMVLTEEKDNRLVECHECHAKYHQKCHKPPVSTADISDPRYLWYCSKCRKLINKRQQAPSSSIKETKANSNSSVSNNKSKAAESPLSTGKKGLTTSITDVPTGFFTFKPKSSESITSDSTTTTNLSASSSTSSLTNGTAPKNTNAWASLATGCKEKKTTPESSTPSASSVLAELTALTSSSNGSNTKRSPPSPKSLPSTSLNPLLKQPINGSNIGSLKSTSSSSKPNTPSSPPVLKTQLSSSKSTLKLLPSTKALQRISSPTPLGRQPSLLKSPPPTTTPTYNRLNSSGSNSSGSNSPSSTAGAAAKIATGLDFEKRLKQMKKMAAEKSLTKKF